MSVLFVHQIVASSSSAEKKKLNLSASASDDDSFGNVSDVTPRQGDDPSSDADSHLGTTNGSRTGTRRGTGTRTGRTGRSTRTNSHSSSGIYEESDSDDESRFQVLNADDEAEKLKRPWSRTYV